MPNAQKSSNPTVGNTMTGFRAGILEAGIGRVQRQLCPRVIATVFVFSFVVGATQVLVGKKVVVVLPAYRAE